VVVGVTRDILIVGASARAAAQSAVRAGLRPYAIDLFADRDLTAIAPTRQVAREEYPGGIVKLAAEFPRMPWIYTGGLENHPSVLNQLARLRPLRGNPSAILRFARNPICMAVALGTAGIPCPEVREEPDQVPRDGRWLMKPWRSAGGLGIQWWLEDTQPLIGLRYFQEHIEGLPMSAVYRRDSRRVRLCGVTRQLLGRPGAPFAYVGSLGPWPLRSEEQDRVRRVGEVVGGAFRLRGLFGIDFILREGIPWPVELNPRYTASVEVLELAFGDSFLTPHGDPREMVPRRTIGKRILYAEQGCIVRDPLPLDDVTLLADIPQSGTAFALGEPILTILAEVPDVETLESLSRAWHRRIVVPLAAGLDKPT
jgi:predicted ATP-grasp superfamily ATP-dependent carboligase